MSILYPNRRALLKCVNISQASVCAYNIHTHKKLGADNEKAHCMFVYFFFGVAY